MKYLLAALIITFWFTQTQAKVLTWSSFCARYFVDDDPYQFQGASSDALAKLYREEGAKTFWIGGKSRYLGVIGAQLRANATVEPLPDETIQLLENYKAFEL